MYFMCLVQLNKLNKENVLLVSSATEQIRNRNVFFVSRSHVMYYIYMEIFDMYYN